MPLPCQLDRDQDRMPADTAVSGSPSVEAVHLVLPSLHVADASGSHTLRARDALRRAGYEADIFVEHVDPPLAGEAYPFEQLDAHVRPGRTALLYQLSVGSAVVDGLLRRSEPLLVNYHNLTPASFFWQWAPEWLDAVDMGWRQLHRLAPRVLHAIADSEYNRRDLVAAGYRSTSVAAPLVGTPAAGPDSRTAGWQRRRSASGARWLFVGKLLPHKGAHRVVQAFAAYRASYDPEARLALVGGTPITSYRDAVRSYVDDLGLGSVVEITGSVTEEALARRYASADVFVCLSAHEGFCFPLLEAMGHGLPIVAADAGAVGDTLGRAGVLLRRPAPSTTAAAVHRVLCDGSLRRYLAAQQVVQLASFSPDRSAGMLVGHVEQALAGVAGR